jgi:hypothetical protein
MAERAQLLQQRALAGIVDCTDLILNFSSNPSTADQKKITANSQ